MSFSKDMSFSNYHTIPSLKEKGYEWRLKVRVLNIWEVIPFGTRKTVGLNMLFVDETNTRILAFAGKDDYQQFLNIISVGKIYSVSNFEVKKYGDETFTRPVRNDFRIFISNYTKFEEMEINDTLIPHLSLDLYDLSDVEKLSAQNLYLTDVVGVIEEVKMTCSFPATDDSPPKTMVPIFISDGRYTAKVLFWNSLADYFLEKMAIVKEKPVVMIISCCKAVNRGGDIHFSNTPATRFYLNSDHYCVDMVRKTLSECPVRTNSSLTKQPLLPPLLNIAQLNELDIHMLNKSVLVEAHFIDYGSDKKWFEYFCTKCQQAIEKQRGKSRCNGCAKNIRLPNRRFRVIAVAKDASGSATILLLNREVRKIIGKTIDQVAFHSEEISTNGEGMDDASVPDILDKILENNFRITVNISESNVTGGDTVYTCTNIEITDDGSLWVSSAEHSPTLPANNCLPSQEPEERANYQGTSTPTTEWSTTKERVIWMTKNIQLDSIHYYLPKGVEIPLMKLETLTGLHFTDICPEVLVKCLAHVVAIDECRPWFNQMCPAFGHKLSNRRTLCYCDSCEHFVKYPLRRLHLRLYIDDEESTAAIHLSHDAANKFIPSAVRHLPDTEFYSSAKLPSTFLQIIGIPVMFVIQTKMTNLARESSIWECVDIEYVH